MSSPLSLDQLKKLIRDVPDFPKPGVLFKDITPVLADSHAFKSLIHHLSELIPAETQKLVAIESRGFILGSAIAQARGLGLVLVRKPGKLPQKTFSHTYQLEYGQDTLQMHEDALTPEDKVTIVDDVLATGGTAFATESLVKLSGAHLLCHVFLLELSFLKGRQRLIPNARSLLTL